MIAFDSHSTGIKHEAARFRAHYSHIFPLRRFATGSRRSVPSREGGVGWPDPPPFRAPVFVLTHNPSEPWVRQGGTTFGFVADGPVGPGGAVGQARKAADGRDVRVSGGAEAVRRCLAAGLLDELEEHISPVMLGAGTPLFDGPLADGLRLEPDRVVASPKVTHVRCRVVR